VRFYAKRLEVEFAKLTKANAVSFSMTLDKGEPAKKKGGMSAAGRAKIAAAQKARWAKVNAGKNGKTEVKVGSHETGNAKPAKKGGMSAAGRAKIAAAARARWAKDRAAKAASK
jgi:hypothetical protein